MNNTKFDTMLRVRSFSRHAKFSEKTNTSYPLICTRTCAYQGVRNVSFSENFGKVLSEWNDPLPGLTDLERLLFFVVVFLLGFFLRG